MKEFTLKALCVCMDSTDETQCYEIWIKKDDSVKRWPSPVATHF